VNNPPKRRVFTIRILGFTARSRERDEKSSKYLTIHSDRINSAEWIIDGFGCVPSAWERFAVADTLIYIDLPLFTHYFWVTKRFLKGIFVNPPGWPDRSPIVRGTITSYRVAWLCHRKLTPRYRKFVAETADKKNVFHLKSSRAIEEFLNEQRHMRGGFE